MRAGDTPRRSFRIASFNLLNQPQSWPRRAPLVARQLAALAPDLVALQEVGIPDEQTATLQTALAAATELPYTLRSCALHRPDGWSEGLALLTNLPVEASAALNVDRWGEVCLWTRIRLEDGLRLDVFNLHLNPHEEDVQLRQVRAVLDWQPAATGGARILCGDFNALPASAVVRLVTDAGFVSAHRAHHGEEPSCTFPTPLRPEIYARRGPACLDYIFIDPASLSVQECRVTLDQPAPGDRALYPSDHAGIVADLSVVA